MSDDFGSAVITLEDGSELAKWQEYSINSEFLTPTDGWSFSFTTRAEWTRLREVVQPDRRVEIRVDGNLQLTGWIDEVKVGCGGSEGLNVNVSGRDILKIMCDANVHPDFRLKGKKIYEVVEALVFSLYPTMGRSVKTDNDSNRDILTGVKGFKKSKKARKNITEIDYCQAKPNEGAFEFLARNLRRFGLWCWSDAEGNIIVSSPDYDQKPAYSLLHKEGEKRVKILKASYTYKTTQAPSCVMVRGKSAAKEWEKKTVYGFSSDGSRKLWVPRYVLHEVAETADQAKAFAEQELSESLKDQRVYECTLRGHTDADTGATYAVDTVVHIEDDFLGVSEDMYVRERTFRRSVSSGTTTELKCVPLGSIRFSDVDHPT
jgi:prophage tail gpP-like protein